MFSILANFYKCEKRISMLLLHKEEISMKLIIVCYLVFWYTAKILDNFNKERKFGNRNIPRRLHISIDYL
jgi:hypothetical protein